MTFKPLLAILISVTLSACSMKEAPDCASDKTKNLIFKIANEQITKVYSDNKIALENLAAQYGAKVQGDPSSIKYSVIGTRVIEKNKDTGNYKCTGTFVAEGKGGKFEMPIDYTSEMVDGGKDFYVGIRGLTEYKIGELLGHVLITK